LDRIEIIFFFLQAAFFHGVHRSIDHVVFAERGGVLLHAGLELFAHLWYDDGAGCCPVLVKVVHIYCGYARLVVIEDAAWLHLYRLVLERTYAILLLFAGHRW